MAVTCKADIEVKDKPGGGSKEQKLIQECCDNNFNSVNTIQTSLDGLDQLMSLGDDWGRKQTQLGQRPGDGRWRERERECVCVREREQDWDVKNNNSSS